ncbi:c-type cytochrome [Caulobacter sp. KR2-114]|uniref:c-type cytochrome n=1 Tax=Caulobacter sp. KR2-114 TaxID=3400912 RepID=UPI003C10BDF1
MSDLTFNKIAGAGLATALIIAGLAVVPPMIFQKHPLTKAGYAIEPVSSGEGGGGGGEAADTPPDWGTVLKTADVAAGQAVSDKCKSCHSFDPGGAPGPSAPSLYGVLGRTPGSSPAFAANYSPAMKAFGGKIGKWDFEHVYEFLHGPQKYIDGTKMTFIGLKAAQDRINLIAYLNTLGSNLPIPAPNPAAAAPAAGASAAPAPAGASAAPAAGASAASPAAGASAATPAASAAAPAKK